jgi:hypothetical protein
VARGGATVTDPGIDWRWAGVQRDQARAWHADLAIAAFGTNDLRVLRREPAAVVDGYLALIEQLAPVPVLIALTPPFVDVDGHSAPAVDDLNRRLAAAFPADRLLDFHTGVDPPALDDGVHLRDAAQADRADRATAALRTLMEDAYGPCAATTAAGS